MYSIIQGGVTVWNKSIATTSLPIRRISIFYQKTKISQLIPCFFCPHLPVRAHRFWCGAAELTAPAVCTPKEPPADLRSPAERCFKGVLVKSVNDGAITSESPLPPPPEPATREAVLTPGVPLSCWAEHQTERIRVYDTS